MTGIIHCLTVLVLLLVGGVFFLAGLNLYKQELIEESMMCFILVFLCIGMEAIIISLFFPRDY